MLQSLLVIIFSFPDPTSLRLQLDVFGFDSDRLKWNRWEHTTVLMPLKSPRQPSLPPLFFDLSPLLGCQPRFARSLNPLMVTAQS